MATNEIVEEMEPVLASPVPAGFHSVTPYLAVDGAAKAIEFYKKAFGATELARSHRADGRVAHAEIKIGDSPLMLADEMPEMGFKSPKAQGGSHCVLLVYFENVIAAFKQAVDAGAKVVRPLQDHYYGDRSAVLEDPFGHVWTIATHTKDVSSEELQKRAALRKAG